MFRKSRTKNATLHQHPTSNGSNDFAASRNVNGETNHHAQRNSVTTSSKGIFGSSTASAASTATTNNTSSRTSPPPSIHKTELRFHCQLAHGSPTGFVSGFSNVKELYQKIADYFEFPVNEIMFCTLNTYKVDMKKLLGGQIGLEDFIFVHKKGRPKEVELVKSEDALGLTITDNGAGYAFIKRIKDGSVIHNIPHIQVGDHIEKLNNESMVGKRHFEVAKILKDIPRGSTFTVRLVEPMRSGFNSIAPKGSSSTANGVQKTGNGVAKGYGSGRETLRFKAGAQPVIKAIDAVMEAGVEKINVILENFLGINDEELASRIWELSVGKCNSMDFAEAIDGSDLEEFGFTDDLLIELWGVITDARDGR